MSDTAMRRHVTTAFVWLTGLIGIALAGYGTNLHLELSAAVRAGNCDGCEPLHPLFVIAPTLVGLGLVLTAVAASRYR